MTVQTQWFRLLRIMAERTLKSIQNEIEESRSKLASLPAIIQDGLGFRVDTDGHEILGPLEEDVRVAQERLRRCNSEPQFDDWLAAQPEWIKARINRSFRALVRSVADTATGPTSDPVSAPPGPPDPPRTPYPRVG